MGTGLHIVNSALIILALMIPNACPRQGSLVDTPEDRSTQAVIGPGIPDSTISGTDAESMSSESSLVEKPKSHEAPGTSFASLAETSRTALVLPCGRCHQSTLDTHKAGAIAIFDLDAGENWHVNLDEERLGGLERRAMNTSSISVRDREQIASFIALKRASFQDLPD